MIETRPSPHPHSISSSRRRHSVRTISDPERRMMMITAGKVAEGDIWLYMARLHTEEEVMRHKAQSIIYI